jgi:hypothetical protein
MRFNNQYKIATYLYVNLPIYINYNQRYQIWARQNNNKNVIIKQTLELI